MALSRTNRGAFGAGGTAFPSSSNTTVTTPNFTPSDNSLLTFVFCGSAGSTVTLANVTIAGGSLSWTEVASLQSATGDGFVIFVKVWRAAVTTGASMQVTVTHPSVTNADLRAMRMAYAFDHTGYNTSSPIGASITGTNLGSGAVALTLSASPASDSEVIAICANAPNGGAALTATPASGWTEQYDTAYAGYAHLQAQTRAGSTSASVNWDDVAVGDTVYSNDSIALAFEIKASAATDTSASAALASPGAYVASAAAALRFAATTAIASLGGYVSSIAAALRFSAAPTLQAPGGYGAAASARLAFAASGSLAAPGGYAGAASAAEAFRASPTLAAPGGYAGAIDADLRFIASPALQTPGAYAMDAEGGPVQSVIVASAALVIAALYAGASGGQSFRAPSVPLAAPGGYAGAASAAEAFRASPTLAAPGGYAAAIVADLRFITSPALQAPGGYAMTANGEGPTFTLAGSLQASGGYTLAASGALRFGAAIDLDAPGAYALAASGALVFAAAPALQAPGGYTANASASSGFKTTIAAALESAGAYVLAALGSVTFNLGSRRVVNARATLTRQHNARGIRRRAVTHAAVRKDAAANGVQ